MSAHESSYAALNSYTWKLIERNLAWTKADYSGAVPVIPLSQQPEFMQSKKPFIIYSNAVHPSSYLYAQRVETIGYTVFATTVKEVNDTLDVLLTAFERQDEAAADVNAWLKTERTATGKDRKLFFTTIRNQFVQKAVPAEQEGGFVGGTILLECKYISTIPTGTVVTSGFTY